ncbi:hypothetical protein E4Z66_08225 [Aliishimia ponticola]|uniref:Adenylate cyclase n=1 Tax=Aliishimia ponticola TaxID=2499833 RepID=A0A4S4NFJ7_9RHOB|nr:hypothetical protein [Aliishimia ponticola]THH36918.1 hypothetical protein E4Z66_08225 [Aliishimia ponticola]
MSVPSGDIVRTHLARIADSRQFRNAPRLSRFLIYVVEQSLAGNSDRLKGYSIGLEVFDKEPNFDPQTDTIVRVQARALRQKLEEYYLQDGASDLLRIVIPKGRYEPVFYAVSQQPDPAQAASQPMDAEELPQAKPSDRPSIAVLPFECIGLGADCASMGLALTEGLISELSRFRGLSVMSRATTENAKLVGLSIRQIYQRFRPDFVLQGGYRIRNARIEAHVQIIDAAADKVLTTERFDIRSDTNKMYDVQDELVARIAARFGVEHGPIGRYAQRQLGAPASVKWHSYAWLSRYYERGAQLDQTGRDEVTGGLE